MLQEVPVVCEPGQWVEWQRYGGDTECYTVTDQTEKCLCYIHQTEEDWQYTSEETLAGDCSEPHTWKVSTVRLVVVEYSDMVIAQGF